MATYNNLSSFATDGVVESTAQGIMLGSMSSLPTAGASYANCIVLYTGATVGDYTQNRFYKCVNSGGTYSWVLTEVADSADLSGYVPTSRTINSKALTSNIVLSAGDVGAVPTSRTVNGKALNSDITLSASDVSAVPTSRTVNGNALSADVILNASDVGALATSVKSTIQPSSSSTNDTVPTSKAVYSYVNPISTAVTNESTTRASADNSLQSQIDALIAKSDVVDIVGTKAELDNYDTSKLGNNDIVKVLSDSTHNDMTTYYRWVITGGTGAWSYIGGEGPYLTTSSAQSTYVPKTTTVNSKALSGNIALDASDVSAIPSSYLNTSAPSSTSTDSQVPTSKAVYTAVNTVDSKLSNYATVAQVNAKQNTLVTQTITVPTALGTVACTGVTASNTVWVAPAPASHDVYATAGVYCSAQGAGTLTFTSSKAPTEAMTVNVVIAN